jgi:hypothetical protein
VLPSGEILTESAAILIYFADLYPQARLAPGLSDPKRAQYLRWMAYVSAAIYAFAWIKDDPMRIVASEEHAPRVIDRVHDRIADCWRMMDGQIAPGRYILGDELSVLDLYVTVISRFGPGARAFTRARRRWPKSSAGSMPTRVSRNSGRSGFHLMRGGSGKRHSTLNTSYARPSAQPKPTRRMPGWRVPQLRCSTLTSSHMP